MMTKRSLNVPSAVIFDVDGVLVDSYQAHLESWQEFARGRGWSVTTEQFAATFGRTTREIIQQRWSQGQPFSATELDEMNEQKEAHYRDIVRQNFPQMPGAEALIVALDAAGFRLAVGSSGPPENVALVLDRVDPRNRIDVAITGNDVTRGKPHPQVFQLAATRLGVASEACIVVEDAPAGITAAHAAGMPCVAVASTGRTKEELQAAEIVVDSLTELSAATFIEMLPGHE